MATIRVILGPMFSGKSVEMVRRVERYGRAGYSCLVVRHSTSVSRVPHFTHDGPHCPAQTVSTSFLSDVTSLAASVDVIGIDDAHFFSDLVEFCRENVDVGNKKVIVAGLDGSYQREGFYQLLRLVPLAEGVVKLSSVCMSCTRDAPFTKRVTTQPFSSQVGGEEKYMAVCEECFEQPALVERSPFKSHPEINFSKICSVPIF